MEKIMSEEELNQKVTIDGIEYLLDDLNENTRAQLLNVQFVDAQIQQLNNELAVSDTARIGYTNALKNELQNIK